MDLPSKTFPPQVSLLDDLQDLDRKLVKLIARRVEILDKISQNRHKSPRAAIRYANEEKELRKNWERAASKLSRDERFLREIFSLLQELTLVPEHLESRGGNLFNLAPSKKPVQFNLPKIASTRESCLWAVLAAGSGAEIELKGQITPDCVIELIKALNQAGAHLSRDANNVIVNRQGGELEWQDKTIFAGDSTFNFYLLSALALEKPGVVKFSGDSSLKLCDLSAWRNTLPLFGARLAHVVPKSKGLPVHQECSGLLPAEVALPADLPADAITALMIASSFWAEKIVFQDNGSPAFAEAKAEVLPLFTACGVRFDDKKPGLFISPGIGLIPHKPDLSLDLYLTSILLAIPAFSGGEAQMGGTWPKHSRATNAVEKLFAWSGIELVKKEGFTKSLRGEKLNAPKNPALLEDLPEWAVPLALAFAANHATNGNKAELKGKNIDLNLAQDFLQLLGAELSADEHGNLSVTKPLGGAGPAGTDISAAPIIWTAPSPAWGMALALGAYLKRNIALTNPALVNSVMPPFWAIYNSLPTPTYKKAEKTETPEPKPRRKIIAKGVKSDLAQLRADYDPESDNEN